MWGFEEMYLRVFTKSLLTPRISSILAAFITLVLIALYSNFYLVLPNFAQKSMYSMLSTERDDYGHISYVLAHLPQKPYKGIFTIGGSGMREALPATTIFEKQLNRSLPEPVFFENLSAFGQTLSESLEITANVIKQGYAKKGSVFVISINPRRFTESPQQAVSLCNTPRLPLIACEQMNNILSEQGYKLQWHPNLMRQQLVIRNFIQGRLTTRFKTAINQLSRFECGSVCLQSLISYSPFHKPGHYFQFAYPDKSMPEPVKSHMKAQIKKLRVPEFNENFKFSMGMLDRLVKLVKDNHYKLILVDLPRAPESYIGYKSIETRYQQLITQFKLQGVVYINLGDKKSFLSSNFYDLDHLRPASRPIIAGELVKSISQYLLESNINEIKRRADHA
jgi:hypothetical protein